jgi:hypothetical protein
LAITKTGSGECDWFTSVIRQDTHHFLISLALEKHCALLQGDCKNAFCECILPPEEIMILCPPSSDLEDDPQEYWLLQKTLYGLRHTHSTLMTKPMLYPSPLVLHLHLKTTVFTWAFFGIPQILQVINHPLLSNLASVLMTLFIFQKILLLNLFSAACWLSAAKSFMGIVEWFLGIHFSWNITPNSVAVHLNQSGFASNLVESFFQESHNPTPTATPYCSGVPIDLIAPSTNDDGSPAQLQHTAAYQSLIGSIGWLSSSPCP